MFALISCLNKATLVANTVAMDPFIQVRILLRRCRFARQDARLHGVWHSVHLAPAACTSTCPCGFHKWLALRSTAFLALHGTDWSEEATREVPVVQTCTSRWKANIAHAHRQGRCRQRNSGQAYLWFGMPKAEPTTAKGASEPP